MDQFDIPADDGTVPVNYHRANLLVDYVGKLHPSTASHVPLVQQQIREGSGAQPSKADSDDEQLPNPLIPLAFDEKPRSFYKLQMWS